MLRNVALGWQVFLGLTTWLLTPKNWPSTWVILQSRGNPGNSENLSLASPQLAGFLLDRLGCLTPGPDVGGKPKHGQQLAHGIEVIAPSLASHSQSMPCQARIPET